jgi:2-C-methyl-D-erythritol 2,4-cyclodiphosphate synthase
VRVGIGYDVHAFATERALVLGGVTIPSERGLAGHSDADVLSHAIADAMLGAAALGDLGRHFPGDDPRWEGASSLDFLIQVGRMLDTVGLRVDSIDATVVIESPSLAPHREEIRKRLADTLRVDIEHLSVKATTTDGIGLIGRGEGAAALAVAVLTSRLS